MKSVASPLLAMLLLAGCGSRHAEPVVRQAWVRLPAVHGQPAAAYFEIEGAGQDEQLVEVASAMAARAELHESMTGAGGMASMKPLARIAIPRGAKVAFAPGGRHVMLFGIDPAVTPGTATPLRFGFASGKTAEAEAKTVPAGSDAPY